MPHGPSSGRTWLSGTCPPRTNAGLYLKYVAQEHVSAQSTIVDSAFGRRAFVTSARIG